ncbi:MAG: MotA/TolQ/ExbB proton channel family protein [Campylobacterales bacterium]|nr:MotA/TolQ/ExbB proton channel family protein [Campylobacterales bacterium]
MTSMLEGLLYQVSNIFLTPVLILIVVLFIYSIFETGVFFGEIYNRKKNKKTKEKGYPVFNYGKNNNITEGDDLEIYAFKKLEKTSIITRVAPMLGLVATMIPMGPALKALANGNVQGISENLIVAFGAVIFALLTSSFTFWITSIRKRWYATEIRDYLEDIK